MSNSTSQVCTIENEVQNYICQGKELVIWLIRFCVSWLQTRWGIHRKLFLTVSFPLFHLNFRGFQEGPILFFFAFAFGLKGPPTVHAPISRFLQNITIKSNQFYKVSCGQCEQRSKAKLTSKFFCHSRSRFAFSAASISSSLALFLVLKKKKFSTTTTKDWAVQHNYYLKVLTTWFSTFHACPLLPSPSFWFPALQTASWFVCKQLVWTEKKKKNMFYIHD